MFNSIKQPFISGDEHDWASIDLYNGMIFIFRLDAEMSDFLAILRQIIVVFEQGLT